MFVDLDVERELGLDWVDRIRIRTQIHSPGILMQHLKGDEGIIFLGIAGMLDLVVLILRDLVIGAERWDIDQLNAEL